MKTGHRIQITLHIDLDETQPADVHDIVHGAEVQRILGVLENAGEQFQERRNRVHGEHCAFGVYVEHVTRYVP